MNATVEYPKNFSMKNGSSMTFQSVIDIAANIIKLNRQHEIGQPHDSSCYSYCHRIGLRQKHYIWKLIMAIMTNQPDKKYRGT
jgi:hypothetical protein